MNENTNKELIKKEISKLIKQIKKCDIAYYTKEEPLLTDAEYDQLINRLEKLEETYPDLVQDNSPTSTITGLINVEQYKHRVPMLSLKKGYKLEEIINFFDNQIIKDGLVADLKIDGVAVSFIYKNGILINMVTRGNGEKGNSINQHIDSVIGLPYQITSKDPYLEIRGELYVKKSEFEKIKIESNNLSNPRSMIIGTILKKQKSNININYFVYGIGEGMQNQDVSLLKALEQLKQFGFNVNQNTMLVNSSEQCQQFWVEALKKRNYLDYEIDGVVFKKNYLASLKEVSLNSKYPKNAFAYKFPSVLAKSIIKEINITVGKTGLITPVGVVEPIKIGEVIIEKANLYNYSEIKRLGLKLNDLTIISRTGDVIPRITGVDIKNRTDDEIEIEIPIRCPACQEPLKKKSDLLFCVNTLNCDAQILAKILHFASKEAANIPFFGKQKIKSLLDLKLIESFSDLFKLNTIKTKSTLQKTSGWNIKSINSLLLNIEEAKKIKFRKFIYAISIKNIGLVQAEKLSKFYKTPANMLNNLRNLNISELNRIKKSTKLNKSAIEGIVEFSQQGTNLNTLSELIEVMRIIPFDKNPPNPILLTTSLFFNKKVSFTGTLTISRSKAKEKIEYLGGSVLNSLNKNVDILIVGEKPGKTLEKAKKLNIKVMNNVEFMNIIKTK